MEKLIKCEDCTRLVDSLCQAYGTKPQELDHEWKICFGAERKTTEKKKTAKIPKDTAAKKKTVKRKRKKVKRKRKRKTAKAAQSPG